MNERQVNWKVSDIAFEKYFCTCDFFSPLLCFYHKKSKQMEAKLLQRVFSQLQQNFVGNNAATTFNGCETVKTKIKIK